MQYPCQCYGLHDREGEASEQCLQRPTHLLPTDPPTHLLACSLTCACTHTQGLTRSTYSVCCLLQILESTKHSYGNHQTSSLSVIVCNQVLYTVAVTVLFPGSILALAAGAVFGLVLGSLLVWIGTVLGQTLAFIIGRFALYSLISAFSIPSSLGRPPAYLHNWKKMCR